MQLVNAEFGPDGGPRLLVSAYLLPLTEGRTNAKFQDNGRKNKGLIRIETEIRT